MVIPLLLSNDAVNSVPLVHPLVHYCNAKPVHHEAAVDIALMQKGLPHNYSLFLDHKEWQGLQAL
jgi:hypothetical protein